MNTSAAGGKMKSVTSNFVQFLADITENNAWFDIPSITVSTKGK